MLFRSRVDDVVVSGGHNVDLGAVEARANAWPERGTAEVVVVGAPDPDWGTMVKEGTVMISVHPYVSLFPAIAIVTLVLGFNLLADGLRELALKE